MDHNVDNLPKLEMNHSVDSNLWHVLVIEKPERDTGHAEEKQTGRSEEQSPNISFLSWFRNNGFEWYQSCVLRSLSSYIPQ